MNVDQIRAAFVAAPPIIGKQIRDYRLAMPSFFEDLPNYDVWPLGQGLTKVEIDYRASMPDYEQGFGAWKKKGGQVGCDPCQTEDCGYNYTKLRSSGINQKVVHPMTRDLITDAICIDQIETTLNYKEFFGKFMENILFQVRVLKEQGVVQNYLSQISKKFVNNGQLLPNPENPYVYRNIGTSRLSNLNPYVLDELYQWLSKMIGVEPLMTEGNAPLFGVAASSQIFNRMYMDNPKLREDLRFSGYANDIITKYNFVTKIQGQFIPVAIEWPRRFNIVNGEPMVVVPWVNGIPANYGEYADVNPAYLEATHEEVLIFGKNPFTIYTMGHETDLGNGATFGKRSSYFETWKWINPQTVEDPDQKFGFFKTEATIGLSSTWSNGLYGLLVERPLRDGLATYFAAGDCPPAAVDCGNEVPDVGCPCPIALSVSRSVFDPTAYTVSLAAPLPTGTVASDAIQFAVDSGGYITGTVTQITSDLTTVEVTFPAGIDPTTCEITGIFCDNTLGCSATVRGYDLSCTDNTQLALILSNPVKGDVGDTITAYFGNGQSASVTVVSQDMLTSTLVVDVGATAFCDQVGGIISICIPPTADATCPSCAQPAVTFCS